MAYRVRTPDGELRFESLYDIERAFAQGLVDENDEVNENDAPTWRKVSAIPALRHTRPPPKVVPVWRTPMVLLPLAGALVALYLLAKGYWYWGMAVVLIVSAAFTHVTYKAFKKRD